MISLLWEDGSPRPPPPSKSRGFPDALHELPSCFLQVPAQGCSQWSTPTPGKADASGDLASSCHRVLSYAATPLAQARLHHACAETGPAQQEAGSECWSRPSPPPALSAQRGPGARRPDCSAVPVRCAEVGPGAGSELRLPQGLSGTRLEGGSEEVGVPKSGGAVRAAAMGGSGSRLSKELLAEYQVRGTPPSGPRAPPAPGRGGLGAAAAARLAPFFAFAFQDLTFLTKQEIIQ